MLSTAEVKARAAEFARQWANASYERGEAQSFYNDFFEVFGVKRRKVASFEEPVKKLGDKRGFLDLFWRGVLLAEHKSSGKSLSKAKQQALEYFPALKDDDLPRYVLVCDFQNFELYDLDIGEEVRFGLADLPDHIEAFNFVRGLEKRVFRDQDPVNIKAAELVGKLHDALEDSDYTGHDLERFLVRIVFCLFADDTGIFDRDIFLDLVERTREDGSDLGGCLNTLFEVLNTPPDKRQKTLSSDLDQFEYINGDLFAERLRAASFDGKMRQLLIDACKFKWNVISPAIFGALFQSVMEPKERRKRGAHYTTELNILKLIRPLFLDRLDAEFQEIKTRRGADRRNKLHAFHDKLAGLTFFDPACGSGNFLIITYRELRRLEIAVLHELFADASEFDRGLVSSKLDVDRFYGIEIEEFSAQVAQTAMWMMDHIMNGELSLSFGEPYKRIPLKKSASILHADALESDWAALLPPEKCDYVLGNPPFSGSKTQSDIQRAQVRAIAKLGGSGGTLDYVAAWFLKAGAYVQPKDCSAEIAFVATNSITQGEQVAQLWPLLFSRYSLEVSFAHRTFAWGSDARGKAHVHVVIIGLTKRQYEWLEKRLFSYDDINADPVESVHRALSPYLFDAGSIRDRHLVVEEASTAISGAPKLTSGSQPIDDGNYIFDEAQKEQFLNRESKALKFFRPYMSGVDYLNNTNRWVLWLRDATPDEIAAMPAVKERIQAVREFRSKSERKSTLGIAQYPTRWNLEIIPDAPFLAIPEVSSERRAYIPIAWLQPPIIPSNKIRFVPNADYWVFAILTSRMHVVWTRYIGGRLKSDFQYSIGINYNTFPWPDVNGSQVERIQGLAQAIINARTKYSKASLADLYDPDAMPADLRKAHQKLDDAVDALYKRGGFASDRERVEHLFMLYEKLVSPLSAAADKRPKRKKAY